MGARFFLCECASILIWQWLRITSVNLNKKIEKLPFNGIYVAYKLVELATNEPSFESTNFLITLFFHSPFYLFLLLLHMISICYCSYIKFDVLVTVLIND